MPELKTMERQIVLVLTLDPGSSLTKIVYQIVYNSWEQSEPKILLMEPQVIEVSQELIEAYEAQRLTSADPENEAWIECEGEFYAVGFLAQKQFYAHAGLNELKYERAVLKLMAAIGAIAEREGLSDSFSVALASLLPYKEWRDCEKFERSATNTLSNFCFRGKAFSLPLQVFECKPEGAGLVLTRGRKLGLATKERVILVLMMGYRDVSFLLFERGKIVDGGTSPKHYGLVLLVERVQQRTSGQDSEPLLRAIHRAAMVKKPGKDKQKLFQELVRSKKPQHQAEEIAQIMEAVRISRLEYWSILSGWLKSIIPTGVDEVVIGGGTAECFRSELKSHFAAIDISWAAELEEDVRLAFNLSPEKDTLCLRLADVYGLSRSLIKKIEGGVGLVRKI